MSFRNPEKLNLPWEFEVILDYQIIPLLSWNYFFLIVVTYCMKFKLFCFKFHWNVGKRVIKTEVFFCIHRKKFREFAHLETYHSVIWHYFMINTFSRWTLWTWNIPLHCFFSVKFFSSANNMVLPPMSLPNLQRISYSIATCAHNSSMVAIIFKKSFTLRVLMPVWFWINVKKVDIWVATGILETGICIP